MKKTYNHGLWFPITDVAPVPIVEEKVFFTEGANTNYELWQQQRYGNYIKAQGSEYAERFINKTDNHE